MITVRSEPEKCWPFQCPVPLEWWRSPLFKKYAKLPRYFQDMYLAHKICEKHNNVKGKALDEMDKLVSELEEKSELIIKNWKAKKDDIRFWQGRDGHKMKQEIYESSRKASDQARIIMDRIEKCSRLCGTATMQMKDVIEEFKYVGKEFDSMEFDPDNRSISVITPAISLQIPGTKPEKHVDFGKFKVELKYSEQDDNRGWNYNITALTPNCPRGDGGEGRITNIIHPHVQGGRMCEGAGKAAISKALKETRLVDFFDLTMSILNEYNPGSPYHKLEFWRHRPCRECRTPVDPDEGDGYACNGASCNRIYCERCVKEHKVGGVCLECGEFFCSAHLLKCAGCDNGLCSGCAKNVKGKMYCKECAKEANKEYEKIMAERLKIAEEKKRELEAIRKGKEEKAKEKAKKSKTKEKTAKKKPAKKKGRLGQEMTPEMQAILEEERKFMEEEIRKLGGSVDAGPGAGEG